MEDQTNHHGAQSEHNGIKIQIQHSMYVEEPVHRNKKPLSRTAWVVLCASLLVGLVQEALDSTITATLQPVILQGLGHISLFPFIGTTYAMCSAASVLFWGKLYLTFDNKLVLLIARILFAIGLALSGAAPSMKVFIAGKGLSGIGGGGTYLGVIAVFTSLISPEDRGRYFSYIGFSWAFGTIFGPVIGGAFGVAAAGWRWAYYFNLILVAVTVPPMLFLLRGNGATRANIGFWTRIREIDLPGTVLFAGALISGMLTILFGGALYPWNSPQVIGLACCAGTVSILFGMQQITSALTTKRQRILPIHILRSAEMWVLIMQVACPVSSLFITIYYIPLYLQFVKGETAIRSAINSLPFLVMSVVAFLVSGRYINRFGSYKLWFIAGSTLAFIMAVCLYSTDINTPLGHLYGYLILGGTGIGLYLMNSGPIMSAIVLPEDAQHAGTLFGIIDTISGAVSVAIANCVFLNQATSGIQKILPGVDRSTLQSAIAGAGAPITQGLSDTQQDGVLQAILSAIKDVWIQLMATAGLSVILSLFMKNEKLKDVSH